MIASASPRRIVSHDSPMAPVPVEHADATAMFGPHAPSMIETWPDAASGSMLLIRNGLTRR